MARKTFHFKVTYFKPSGKYYTEAGFDLEVTSIEPGGSAYMPDAIDHLVRLRDGSTKNAMPGITGQWRGHILLECDKGYPCLIPAVVCDTE